MPDTLPADFEAVVAAGVTSLRRVEAGLRAAAAAPGADPALWLRVRDAGGLADRLAGEDAWTWRTGFARIHITDPDLAALEAFAAACEERSPYRDDPPAGVHAAHLRALAAFLRRYEEGGFALEDPAAYPHPSGAVQVVRRGAG